MSITHSSCFVYTEPIAKPLATCGRLAVCETSFDSERFLRHRLPIRPQKGILRGTRVMVVKLLPKWKHHSRPDRPGPVNLYGNRCPVDRYCLAISKVYHHRYATSVVAACLGNMVQLLNVYAVLHSLPFGIPPGQHVLRGCDDL